DPAWRELALPPELQWSEQGEGDLGARMARAALRGLDAGLPVLLIGTDCPALDSDVLCAAASALNDHDAAITPTADGGYALLGLNHFHASLFDDMRWSVSTVADETLERMGHIGWRVARLPAQHDIDEPLDLQWLPAGWLPSVIEALPTN
ncbi:MAG: TIGR04282 family arsenosugar biosynthesis glycosyltransferase, partial [Azoarcus sp.]